MPEENFQPSQPQTALGSACSSVTVLPHNVPDVHLPTDLRDDAGLTTLDHEIIDDERRIEKYGGDDIREPPKKETSTVLAPAVKQDPNMVDWDGPDDPANPQNFSMAKKWAVTAICIALTLSVSFGSSAPASAVTKIILEFGINRETSYSTLTLYLLGFVFGPSLWGPGSEMYGRRGVLILTMAAFTLFHLGQALGKNIETFLVTRFFCGFFGVAPLTISGGIIADVWPALGRGPATSLFSASTFLGPVLGPIVGGYIAQSNISWRWVVWVSMIFAGVATAFTVFFLPETYAPVLLLRKAKRLRKENPEASKELYAEHEKLDFTVRGILHRTVWRPFQMLAIEPILLLITLYTSLIYGVLYALFEALPLIFMGKHGFSAGESGLVFIGVGVGSTLGSLINYFCSTHYPELVVKWRGFPPPEERLYGAMIGAPMMVIGAFWLGWTGAYPEVHWAAPAVATVAIGMAISLIFISFLSYLVDTYLMYSASAFASNTVIRSLVGAAFPLFTVQMYTNMGINWASTLIGLVSLLLTPMPFLFFKFGRVIRARSKFAPCIDLKIAKEMEETGSNEKQSA
ncbi:MFS polyamine transporter [Dendrothele bispora CBS 962.96]|uniref:MFS polyamine transporter n=1 Tax=Dendrothele bispora (strain CBS 962.96) TaxID=1314807 RepID=A0A4S8MCF1_DENBC|nr:MFS polyamine transporter [Dendrothele bispora CBS 962.96]